MAFFKKTYKVRKVSTAGGHEISLPPSFMEKVDDVELEVLYDPRAVVILAKGVKVNEKVLEAAFERMKND